jgi:hypothetical protein
MGDLRGPEINFSEPFSPSSVLLLSPPQPSSVFLNFPQTLPDGAESGVFLIDPHSNYPKINSRRALMIT